MIDLLLFPFTFAWELLCAGAELLMGLVSLLVGLAGGAVSLALHLAGVVLFVGLIGLILRRRRDYRASQEDFTSFYNQDGSAQ